MVQDSSYNRNTKLRRANTPIEYTKEQIAEYVKCSEDCEYFISHYVQIISLDHGLVQFKPYKYQVKILDSVVNNRFTIVKLPRQAGKTTIMAAILLWYALFNTEFRIGVLAHKEKQAIEIMNRVKKAFENLPSFLTQGITKWNEGSIKFENGSEILSSGTTKDSMRGESLNILYLDEFAIVESNIQEEFMKSVYPVVTAGTQTKIIITSTPKGLNYFYKMWKDSEEGNNSYNRVEIHWSETPGRDEAWKEETIRNTSEEQFRQEFETEFLGSSRTLINGQKLAKMKLLNPIYFSREKNLKIFENPDPLKLYAIIVDTSRGTNGDFSAFIVVDISVIPYNIVATFKDNTIDPMIYPSVIRQVAMDYNEAAVLIESNDIGGQVVSILVHDLEYERVLRSVSRGRNGLTVSDGGEPSSQLGVRTTAPVKKIGCLNLKTLVEKDRLILNDHAIIEELSRFVQKGSSYEAEPGSHDDLAMCCVLFAWLTAQDYFKNITDLDTRRHLLDEQQKRIEENVLPFGFIHEGIPEDYSQIQTIPFDEFDRWLMS